MKNIESNNNYRTKDVNLMSQEEISALKEKEIAEVNKFNQIRQHLSVCTMHIE